MSSPITPTQSSNTLAHIPGTFALISCSCPIFTVYPNRIIKRHPIPYQVIIHHSAGGQSARTQGETKIAVLNSIYISPGLSPPSYLSSILTQPPPSSHCTQSIQPNFGLPCTCSPLTSIVPYSHAVFIH